ncbi:MAG: ABC transporter permease [Lachnospiraceae bacterium]|nr:ABC transporter permease [Lachnospiraceae bacterium]
MRFLDLLRMSSSSLWKRKVRTFLTVLGVVVGTASIVVMISLGLGLNKSSMEQIERYGGLTTINVSEASTNNYAMAVSSTVSEKSKAEKNKKRLDDAAVEQIAAIPHVEIAAPILQVSVLAKYGVYECYMDIQGMSHEALQKKNIDLGQGTLPEVNSGALQLVYGNMILGQFSNTKNNASYWTNGVLPDIDLMKSPLWIIYDTDAYNQSKDGGKDGKVVAPPKKYMAQGAGIVAGDMEDYNENSWNVYCDLDALKAQLKKAFKNKPIPGQPLTPSGKSYKELYYTGIYVNVDDMNELENVQTQITALGYQANSNSDWVKSTKEQFGYIQAVLGGIGAVALFVAAIGITNTMMMSIYERTKEIGVMKVLGCDLKNIQTMFLMEAGYIGFIGGTIGVALSYGISIIINAIMRNSGSDMTSLSYIPVWLSGFAIVFAIVVGMVAGFFPSLRAMKLSPLSAIRNE